MQRQQERFSCWAKGVRQGTWGDDAPELDYYLYSTFGENPSNQCLAWTPVSM